MQKPLVFEIEDLGWGGCHIVVQRIRNSLQYRKDRGFIDYFNNLITTCNSKMKKTNYFTIIFTKV